ncbi:MAG: lytic transglycosylase domain-containing protein [Pseudomonadota bacterium]
MRYLFRIPLAAGFMLCTLSPVAGQEGPVYADFTFKREKVPTGGQVGKITVQIDPDEQAAILAARPKPAARGPILEEEDVVSKPSESPRNDTSTPEQAGDYAWFWTRVPADLAANATQRLQTAFLTLDNGPSGETVMGPRLQTIQTIAQSQGSRILRATIGTDVSPALVLAVIAVESSGRPDAQSHAGAQGLMQLMPATADRFGVEDSFAPDQNIRGGVAYLDWLLEEFEGDAVLALAGYNAGEGAVKRHGGVPPFNETRDYVPKVLAAFKVAGALCKTRPELITDACALNLASATGG